LTTIYLGLGSNIERKKNFRFALTKLGQAFGDLQLSNIYETKAEGFIGDNFYNMVIKIESSLNLTEINKTLKGIEEQAGRTISDKKFAPRTLDIDILLFGNENHQPELDIPRKEITRYNFVLQPLSEIAPELIHPEHHKTMATLKQELMPDDDLSPSINL
jgi:2-amino-4-hydroxy-6-hydroxymethyldihydropteridine diphosphokinase